MLLRLPGTSARIGLPKSLLFLVLTGVVFLLQAIPTTGIFLMFMLAPFWSVALVNAAVIGAGVEAGLGSVSSVWLSLPIAWFGGYISYAALQHHTLDRLHADIASSNAAVRIPFDAALQQLVLTSASDATFLIDNYDIPMVFVAEPGRGGPSYRSYRMAGEGMCAKLGKARNLNAFGIYTTGLMDLRNSLAAIEFDRHFCNVSLPEHPTLPAVVAETDDAPEHGWLLPVSIVTTSVRTPDGRSFALRDGTASVLRWFPMPVMGCGLNDAAPSWDCFAAFVHDALPLQPKQWRYQPDVTELARALGLRAVAAEDRRGVDPEQLRHIVQERLHLIETTQLDALDSALAGGTNLPAILSFDGLRGRLDLLQPRLERMVGAIENAVFSAPRARPDAVRIFYLIKSLPEELIAPYRARLEAVWLRDKYFEYGRSSALPLDSMPERCKTARQRAMRMPELARDIAEQRNQPVSDKELIAAYHDPDCHPEDSFGASALGINRGATVKLGYANGHVLIFYTPGQLAKFDAQRNVYSYEWVKGQTCETIGGVQMAFGPRNICAPLAVAPFMTSEADSL